MLLLGPSVAGLAILWAFARLWRDPAQGHWATFTGAAARLWSEQPVYGFAIGDNPWYYSPSAGLLVYGPFHWVASVWTAKAALILYSALSALVFCSGLRALALREIQCARIRSVTWILVAPALYSALQAHKLETLITGILLWALARKSAWMAVIAGVSAEWKLQSLPPLGLAWLAERRATGARPRLPWIIIGMTLSTLTPWVCLSGQASVRNLREWIGSLSAHSAVSYSSFDNLYAFSTNVLGWAISYDVARGAALAAAMACALTAWAWGRRGTNQALAAAGLGACYTALFSPLQQINAYVLLAPAWLAALMLIDHAQSAAALRRRAMTLAALWLPFTLAYSDLIPDPLRSSLRHAVVRAPIVLALAFWLIWTTQKNSRIPARR